MLTCSVVKVHVLVNIHDPTFSRATAKAEKNGYFRACVCVCGMCFFFSSIMLKTRDCDAREDAKKQLRVAGFRIEFLFKAATFIYTTLNTANLCLLIYYFYCSSIV